MKQRYLLILFVCLLTGTILSQGVYDSYRKVEKKLVADKKYLNVYAVSFQPKPEELAGLLNIPKPESGGVFSFRVKDNVSYQFIILKENYELDSLVILAVREIEDKAASTDNFFGETTGANTIDSVTVLTFGDLQELYFSNNPVYQKFYKIVESRLQLEDPPSMLGIKTGDKISKSRGITSPDNQDFLNFAKANSIHRYPKAQLEKRGLAAKRRGAVDPSSLDQDFQIDVDFSHLSFFHNSMDFGFSTISAEVNTEAKGLNMVPYQPMSLSFGIRTLINVGSGIPDLKKDFILDAKIMGRMRLDLSRAIDNIPFISGDKPLLNVGSGIILDVAGTRAYGLPFFNLYFANGTANISNPYTKSGPADSSTAYFTFKQWETTFSFYWNSSEDKVLRYRMDVGMGSYDVYKAVYYQGSEKQLIYNKVKPVLALYINFAPQNVDFLGTSLKFYDNVLTASLWMKLMEFAPSHTIRFETTYITSPMFRSQYSWENQGGSSIVQLRYRYGLN